MTKRDEQKMDVCSEEGIALAYSVRVVFRVLRLQLARMLYIPCDMCSRCKSAVSLIALVVFLLTDFSGLPPCFSSFGIDRLCVLVCR